MVWKTGRRRHQVAARLGDDSGGEWNQQAACRWVMEDPAGDGAVVFSSRHALARAGTVGGAERPVAEGPLAQAELSVYSTGSL